MADLKELEKGFFDTLAVLKDVLPEMVVVGGWCPYLYALHLWEIQVPEIPTTTDIDLGVLETGNKRFEKTVYDRLKSSGYALQKLYADEETPVEFIYKKRAVKLKVEFITSFEASDDTLNRFFVSRLFDPSTVPSDLDGGIRHQSRNPGHFFRHFRYPVEVYRILSRVFHLFAGRQVFPRNLAHVL